MKDLLKQLQELADLSYKATEGPWRAEMDGEDFTPMILSDYGHVANIQDINFGSTSQEEDEAHPNQPEDNAEFIAAARNVLTPENLTLIIGLLGNMESVMETNRVLASRLLLLHQVPEVIEAGQHKTALKMIAQLIQPIS